MNILIVTPTSATPHSGNRISADRYSRLIKSDGHNVLVSESFQKVQQMHPQFLPDVLIALHAKKSAGSVKQFKAVFPCRSIVVVLTGTDLHRDLPDSVVATKTILAADHLVILEPNSLHKLPIDLHAKTKVIIQSATPVAEPQLPTEDCFEIVVVGHLRSIKDPFRAAMAIKRLPKTSRVKLVQIGAALSDAMHSKALKLNATCQRYDWIGDLGHEETQNRIARARLLILSSKHEGGPSVICEAIVNGTPVLSSRISATVGMLGKDYPGFYEVGRTETLRELILRAESNADWYQDLIDSCSELQPRFAPQHELGLWRDILHDCVRPL